MKRTRIAFTIVFIVVLFAGGYFLWSSTQEESAGTAVSAEPTTAPGLLQLSDSQEKNIRLSTYSVKNTSVLSPIVVPGTVKLNENLVYLIGSSVQGVVTEDFTKVGDKVQAGQTLAIIKNTESVAPQASVIEKSYSNSNDIAQTQIDLQIAYKNAQREKQLYSQGISSKKEYIEAQSKVDVLNARLDGLQQMQSAITQESQAIKNAYGLAGGGISSTVPIVSPYNGVVLKKELNIGRAISNNQNLYQIVDLSEVWLELTIYPEQIQYVHIGDLVQFSTEIKKYSTHIQWMSPVSADGRYTARCTLKNIHPGVIGQAEIQQSAGRPYPFVPKESVQKYKDVQFVFKKIKKNQYAKTVVQIYKESPGGYLIAKGIASGDNIVQRGSDVLKSELLKSELIESEE